VRKDPTDREHHLPKIRCPLEGTLQ